MQHPMRLLPAPFQAIKSGKKTIEVRLNDEKRQKFNVGDVIKLSKRPELVEKITVKIVALFHYKTFEELVKKQPIEEMCSTKMNEKEFLDGMLKHYSKEQEAKLGILAIKIKLI
jgi:ASC-1-like (ASCH) protein